MFRRAHGNRYSEGKERKLKGDEENKTKQTGHDLEKKKDALFCERDRRSLRETIGTDFIADAPFP